MYNIAQAAQPITGRGVGYKLFTIGLIPSMEKDEMRRVYRLLKEARERGYIPWDWIVDETRELERVPTWDDPEAYAVCCQKLSSGFLESPATPHYGSQREGNSSRCATTST
jgi:hypothetical protein